MIFIPVELRKRVEADPAETGWIALRNSYTRRFTLSVCNSVGAALRAPSELR